MFHMLMKCESANEIAFKLIVFHYNYTYSSKGERLIS